MEMHEKKIRIPDFQIEPIVKRETKKILKYPNGIYLLSIGKIIPEAWKRDKELIVDVEVLEYDIDHVVIRISKREEIKIDRW